jgi:site-specific recombinase XerD
MRTLIKKIRQVLKVRKKGESFVSEFSSVQKLLDYLWLRKSGSEVSIADYCWHATDFCFWAKMNPDKILSKSREELEELCQRYLDGVRSRCIKRGSSARTANNALACLKTFFRVNGFNRENNKDLRLQGYHQPPRTRNRMQYVPTLDEAKRMAERAGNKRNRALVYVLFSTGLRNTSVRALRVKDVNKELAAGCSNLLAKVEPEWNKRLPGACKNSIPYYTFTSEQATKAIKEMLEEREAKLGAIREDEPLFIAGGPRLKKKMPFSDREEGEVVKKAAKEVGIEQWNYVTPHALRKVFESILRSPLKDGDRMDPKDQEFLMGHILPGTQDAYYDWTKINRLRNSFSKLVFEEKRTPEIESLYMYQGLAQIIGINLDETKKKKEEELCRNWTPKEEKETLEASIRSKFFSAQDIGEQKIIRKEELQKYLDSGWRFLNVIDQQLMIVTKPSSNVADFSLASLIAGTTQK